MILQNQSVVLKNGLKFLISLMDHTVLRKIIDLKLLS